GENERAARYHGNIQAHILFLEAAMPPASVLQHEQVVARIERELGSDAFATVTAAGEATDRRVAVEEARAWVESLVAPALRARRAPRGDLPGRRNDGALSDRQLEVLRVVASGLSNKEIALELGISTKTVEHHAEAIFRKLRVRGRTEATAWAHRHGLLDG
ncbi:MAG: LuxR family transcriptional regulator, partial [Actinomycetia bacterium]|nr:LuxR family transcriptional regulator [Actinomycetes bacterium]